MRRAIPARLFAVALAISSLSLIPLSAPAPAATLGASCTKLVSPAPVTINKILTSKSTVSGCLPLAATGGSGKGLTQIGIKVGGKTITRSTTTWAGGKGTTIQTVSYKPGPKPNKCPVGTTLIVSTSVVTGGSGAALKAIPKGHKGAQSVCVTSKNTATLLPGSSVKY